jgi:hypothetical protein
VRTTLIDKDQFFCQKATRVRVPSSSLLFSALCCSERLYFRVQPSRAISRLIVQRLKRSPHACSHMAQYCIEVASACACTWDSMAASMVVRFFGGRPEIAVGRTYPFFTTTHALNSPPRPIVLLSPSAEIHCCLPVLLSKKRPAFTWGFSFLFLCHQSTFCRPTYCFPLRKAFSSAAYQ